MPDPVLTVLAWGLDVLPTMAAVGALWLGLRNRQDRQAETIAAQFERTRRESEDGRAKLYEKIEKMRREVASTYVPREMHDRDMQSIRHALDESAQITTALAGRACPYPPEGNGR